MSLLCGPATYQVIHSATLMTHFIALSSIVRRVAGSQGVFQVHLLDSDALPLLVPGRVPGLDSVPGPQQRAGPSAGQHAAFRPEERQLSHWCVCVLGCCASQRMYQMNATNTIHHHVHRDVELLLKLLDHNHATPASGFITLTRLILQLMCSQSHDTTHLCFYATADCQCQFVQLFGLNGVSCAGSSALATYVAVPLLFGNCHSSPL